MSPDTTTDACYRDLIEAGLIRSLEKIDAIDRLLHDRPLPFDDLCRMVSAELHIACKQIKGRLDPARPLIIFADHGFRLDPKGERYVHGGDSTLERVVPVLYLDVFDSEQP